MFAGMLWGCVDVFNFQKDFKYVIPSSFRLYQYVPTLFLKKKKNCGEFLNEECMWYFHKFWSFFIHSCVSRLLSIFWETATVGSKGSKGVLQVDLQCFDWLTCLFGWK